MISACAVHRLRTFTSPVEAMAAAAFLWRAGIPAGVFPLGAGSSLAPTSHKAARHLGAFELVIASRERAVDARRLLAEMDAHPPEFEPGWEAAAASPDLAALDPALAPPCPACSRTLPLDARVLRCPSCRAPVNVPELILERHGPEALAGAFDHSPGIPDDALQAADVPCPACQYPLAGLPIEGSCPECGHGYRKTDCVRIWFG